MRSRPALPAGAYRIQQPSANGQWPSVQPARQTGATLTGRRRGTPLRTRLVVAMLSVTLIPLLATTIGGVYLARQSLVHQGEQVLQRRAGASVATISGYLDSIRSSLAASSDQISGLVAADPALSRATRNAIRDILSAESAANDFKGGSGATEYLTADGHIAVSDQPGDEGQDVSKSPTVRAAQGGVLTISGALFDPTASSHLSETMEAAVRVPAGGLVRERFSLEKIKSRVASDADAAGGGGLLIERDTGLVVAQSIDQKTSTIASIAPLSPSTVQQLADDQRYSAGTPTFRPISGLDMSMLKSGCVAPCAPFTAGTFADLAGVTMRYVRVDVDTQAGPTATPWIYLLARPEAAMTAPADLLELVAAIVGIVSLIAAVIAGFSLSRWSSSWLGAALQQLGSTASAFLALSNEQRQTADEQRHRLAAARSSLQDLHRMAGELSEAIERGIGAAEETAHGNATYNPFQAGQPARRPALGAQTDSQRAWWAQWSVAVRERLFRQHDICTNLTRDVHLTAETAARMRQRSAAVSAQAAAIETSLWRGNAAVATSGQGASASTAPATTRRGWRAVSAGFGTGTLRLVLLGLLAAFGLLPSVVLASSTNSPLRGQLTDQGTQALHGQAQSRATALEALLVQQQEAITGLIPPGSDLSTISQSHDLAKVQAATDSNLGTRMLAVATPDGIVVAASSHAIVGTSVAKLSVFQTAVRSHPSNISSAYYAPSSHEGWYYIAAPIRTEDQATVLGVAIGKFSLGRVGQLVADASMQGTADDGSFTLIVERADAIVLADSRDQTRSFVVAGQPGQSTLNTLWHDGRYPSGQMPPVDSFSGVASHVKATDAAGTERSFTSAPTATAPANQYWLVPLASAPWDLVEAQPAPVATAVADQLTRFDLYLSMVVTVLAVLLALILAQSIIVPIQRLRARFRQIAHRLVTVTRRQEEAARRQEAVLPPIEATAELLGLETEEVTQVIFARPAPAQLTPQALPQPQTWVDPAGWVSSSGPNFSAGVSPSRQQVGWPVTAPSVPDSTPPMDALRQARVMADDWNMRQQRILADLASALNATDELGRASLDGQREATELANVADDLMASTR